MYGGHNDAYLNLGSDANDSTVQAQQSQFNQVYVLTLPGFVWFKSDDSSAAPRTGHTCELIGNRQMVSIGGLDPSKAMRPNFQDVDTNPQGLGIFDLVQLRWTGAYDANASPYQLPSVVQDWYNSPESNSSVQWSSAQLQTLFASPNTGTSSTASSTASSSPSNPSSPSSTENVGAIAGGVIGGVLCLALIGGLTWIFLRRRRRRSQLANQAETTGFLPLSAKKPFLVNQNYTSELSPNPAHQLLDSRPLQHELEVRDIRNRELQELSSS